jgi:hypothetical protein
VTKSKRPYKTDFEVLKAFGIFFLLEEALLRAVALLVLQLKLSFDVDMVIRALPFSLQSSSTFEAKVANALCSGSYWHTKSKIKMRTS